MEELRAGNASMPGEGQKGTEEAALSLLTCPQSLSLSLHLTAYRKCYFMPKPPHPTGKIPCSAHLIQLQPQSSHPVVQQRQCHFLQSLISGAFEMIQARRKERNFFIGKWEKRAYECVRLQTPGCGLCRQVRVWWRPRRGKQCQHCMSSSLNSSGLPH